MRDSSNRKKERNHYFYECFINLDNLKKIGDETIYSKVLWWNENLGFFAFIPAMFSTMFGFSAADVVRRFFFVMMIANQIIAIRYYIKMENVFLPFDVFKKQWMGVFIPGLHVFLSIIFTLLPIFVGPVFVYPDIVNFGKNLIFFGCIYIPSVFFVIFFNYYVYEKPIRGLLNQKNVLAYRYSVADDTKNNVNDEPIKRNIRF